ncbi:hypothetical protein EJB06_31180, partial [Massilia atriviolacea]
MHSVALKAFRIGKYEANAFGLHDTLGNIAEFVQDCEHDNDTGAPADGSAWVDAACKYRVLRGGSWHWRGYHASQRGAGRIRAGAGRGATSRTHAPRRAGRDPAPQALSGNAATLAPMDTRHTVMHPLRSFPILKKRRDETWAARLLAAVWLALAVTLALMLVSVLLMGKAELSWWTTSLANNLLFGSCAAASMLLLMRACEWLLPQAWIDALSAMQGWRPAALMSAILFAGAALGVRAGYAVLGQVHSVDFWQKLSGAPMVQLKFGIFGVLVLAANWVWWQFRAKEKALAQQAAESQLRMLQAQIEPHFLFNTLANVQSLIATDAPRAQRMLETFTDYLRASLGQMRAGDSSLGAELDTAHNYLQLMQIRMGSRLTFSIDASEAVRQAPMPPLLLQPLVENAVHHGVGPKLDGGHVRIGAVLRDGQLENRGRGRWRRHRAGAPRRRQWRGADEYPRAPRYRFRRPCRARHRRAGARHPGDDAPAVPAAGRSTRARLRQRKAGAFSLARMPHARPS